MPRKLLKQALGVEGVDSGESSPGTLDDSIYAISSLNFNIAAKREKLTRTEEHSLRRAQQEKETEEEGKMDEEFLAFDCHISNPLTKEQVAVKMHLDTKATKSVINSQLAKRLHLRVDHCHGPRARLANGSYIPIQGTTCFIMKLQGVKAGIDAIVIDNPGQTSDFLLGAYPA